MATSTIKTGHATILYGNGTYRNDIGKTITLSDDIKNYEFLRITLYGSSLVSAQKCLLTIPNMCEDIGSGNYPVAFNGTNYVARLNINGTEIGFTSCTASAAFIANVRGFKKR